MFTRIHLDPSPLQLCHESGVFIHGHKTSTTVPNPFEHLSTPEVQQESHTHTSFGATPLLKHPTSGLHLSRCKTNSLSLLEPLTSTLSFGTILKSQTKIEQHQELRASIPFSETKAESPTFSLHSTMATSQKHSQNSQPNSSSAGPLYFGFPSNLVAPRLILLPGPDSSWIHKGSFFYNHQRLLQLLS